MAISIFNPLLKISNNSSGVQLVIALLFTSFCSGIASIQVIYRASSDNYAQAYAQVERHFASITFLKQGTHPRGDFKPLTIQAFNAGSAPYVIFAVDDIMVKDTVNLAFCAHMLEQTGAYGFYLRMGLHLTECYTIGCAQPLPAYQHIQKDMCMWRFCDGVADWNYPHSVDMTLVRRADVAQPLYQLTYHAPNVFEWEWAKIAGPIMHEFGLCFAQSKIVNVPLNRVQNDVNNKAMTSWTPEELLEIFNNGLKIDIAKAAQDLAHNKGAHTEYEPTFIPR